MAVADRLSSAERKQVESAVSMLFSVRSDYADIKSARLTIETIAQKYAGD
jgi:hypothetical protein